MQCCPTILVRNILCLWFIFQGWSIKLNNHIPEQFHSIIQPKASHTYSETSARYSSQFLQDIAHNSWNSLPQKISPTYWPAAHNLCSDNPLLYNKPPQSWWLNTTFLLVTTIDKVWQGGLIFASCGISQGSSTGSWRIYVQDGSLTSTGKLVLTVIWELSQSWGPGAPVPLHRSLSMGCLAFPIACDWIPRINIPRDRKKNLPVS